ncbi:MAG: ABC transporter substrate-binding protein [Bacillota bacterium]|uniref:ABC transporter substrate-binding protein n=1 Tax=Virgibacillus TaxID=84406 RepID=UPI000414794A|nr:MULTISPECIES: ABC transporter substrate-binding protein [Bacillaceae]MCC2252750.1 ABC transporter substrate-binding protein [Virgibacillus sp. AGTR]MDY7046719.1 ABC transporter substrate-binding protein [Virgibacillus sp. M23]QRZ16889.1 ABC transporter substrate-binding protein [Virgibacillus sp. AGTR]
MKRFLGFIVILGILALTACGSDENDEGTAATDDKSYQIGVSQIVEHPSLDAAYEGFQEALNDAGINAEFDFQSAQGDQNNIKPISDGFVADSVDLIFANSTPSAIGALQATRDIPIVFTSVTDAVEAGLIKTMEEPGDNITGVVDLHPDAIAKTVEFIETYFSDATVGMLYNAGEQNSVTQVDAVKTAAEGTGITIEERTVATSSEVQQAATSLVSDVDLFYIITDNTVVSALDSVVGVANDQDIPLIVGEPDSLAKGGFATFGIDYNTIGYRTGEMAAAILKGDKAPSDFLVEYPPELQLFINKQAAEEQNVEWNTEWDESAQFLEAE